MRAASLDGIVVAVGVDDASRFGSLDVDDDGLLRSFHEKAPGKALVNAGVYVFEHETLEQLLPPRAASLELDLIPGLLRDGGRIGVAVVEAPFIDIGVPEALSSADAFVAAHLGRT